MNNNLVKWAWNDDDTNTESTLDIKIRKRKSDETSEVKDVVDIKQRIIRNKANHDLCPWMCKLFDLNADGTCKTDYSDYNLSNKI